MSLSDEEAESASSTTLTKSQMKKRIKREKWLSSRGDRRKLEREKRKNRRKELAQEREKLLADGEKVVSNFKRIKLMTDSDNKFRIVIDMNFEEYMTDSEIAKAVKQVGRIYAANRRSEQPCQLYITSLVGKIKDQFEITNTGYKNWDANCSELSYMDLFRDENDVNKKFVYLSGDAIDSLPSVDAMLDDASRIYIIGGLVDHNRHKNLCQTLASKNNIATARLPIHEHMKLNQRHILSTVTVFDIMLNILGSHKQWPEALADSIPKRKIVQTDK